MRQTWICFAVIGLVCLTQTASAQVVDSTARGDSAYALLRNIELRPDALASSIRNASAQIVAANTKAEEINRRWAAGTDAIGQMSGALNTVSLIHAALLVEQDFNRTTNIWGDAEIQKGWDSFQKWSSVSGLAMAGVSLIAIKDPDKRANLAGVGIGASGLISIVGNFIGPTSSKRLKEKVDFIDFTRAAFDDIRLRSDLSEAYLIRNDSVVSALTKFNDDIYSKAITTDQKAQALAQLDWYVRAFDASLEQVPQIIAMQETMIARYRGQPVQGTVKTKLDLLTARVQDFHVRYENKVRGFLALTPKLRATLMGLGD